MLLSSCLDCRVSLDEAGDKIKVNMGQEAIKGLVEVLNISSSLKHLRFVPAVLLVDIGCTHARELILPHLVWF